MRDIKFRAWDKVFKKMDLDIQNKGLGVYLLSNTSYEVMQYTGMKDKNLKEIWEGDIVKLFIDRWYEVMFENGCFKLRHSSGATDGTLSNYGMINVEVVGNIYENPDLLTS